MTSEQTDKWKQLEQSLDGLFCHVKARADGYDLSFVKARDGQRLVIWVYVDGVIEGEWCRAKNGEAVHPQAKFWCPKRAIQRPVKEYNSLKKLFGREKADQMTSLRVYGFLPVWKSPRSLVRHLKKNFPDLEILEATHV